MFGGDIQVPPWYLGDTWLWDGQRWSRVPASGAPASASRQGALTAADQILPIVVLVADQGVT
jgi:hypothetical protein